MAEEELQDGSIGVRRTDLSYKGSIQWRNGREKGWNFSSQLKATELV